LRQNIVSRRICFGGQEFILRGKVLERDTMSQLSQKLEPRKAERSDIL
jgi:hypothetical protein